MDDSVGGMDIDSALGQSGTDIAELIEFMAVLERDGEAAVEAANQDIMAVLKSPGGSGGRCRRERQRAIRAVVFEIYSPPRATAAAKLLPLLSPLLGGGAAGFQAAGQPLHPSTGAVRRGRTWPSARDEYSVPCSYLPEDVAVVYLQ